jgi:hypothetical protein
VLEEYRPPLRHQTIKQIAYDGLVHRVKAYNRNGAIVWRWTLNWRTALLGEREFAAIAFENVPYEQRANEGGQ